ncbi:hypothetical protein IE077_001112, partial [Cardiosporidium cionae]
GYYCTGGASLPTPVRHFTNISAFGYSEYLFDGGDMCPPGYYCPAGSSEPTLCPDLSKTSFALAPDASYCFPCISGFYCQPGQRLLCSSGLVCNGSSTSIQPSNNSSASSFCKKGSYCPAGSSFDNPCFPGTYASDQGQIDCQACLPGFYCNEFGVSTPTPCFSGYECKENSIFPTICKPGTIEVDNICVPCPTSYYCNSYGATEPTGPCAAGFYCSGGASSPMPVDQVYLFNGALNGQCPQGHYCEENAIFPSPCLPGFFQNETMATKCLPCPAGYFCGDFGLINPSGLCSKGYYCKEKASSPTPMDGATGNLCPIGHFCTSGTVSPIGCPIGTYSNKEGAFSCLPCIPGYFCGGNSITPIACLPNRICDSMGLYQVCPAGSIIINKNVLRTDIMTSCQSCPLGFFCRYGQRSPCDEGFLCGLDNINSNTTTDPSFNPRSEFSILRGASLFLSHTNWKTDLSRASGVIECPLGHYCTRGTSFPTPCPFKTYLNRVGGISQSDCLPCSAGEYCSKPGIAKPEVCPRGFYCTSNGLAPIRCPSGTFSTNLSATSPSTCLPCPAGFYCSKEGIADIKDILPCPTGFFCPQRTIKPFPCLIGYYQPVIGAIDRLACLICPEGFTCPEERMDIPLRCEGGFYCPLGSAVGIPCPSGNYCPPGSIIPLLCDKYYECPVGSEYSLCDARVIPPNDDLCADKNLQISILCQPGSFRNTILNKTSTLCSPCPP